MRPPEDVSARDLFAILASTATPSAVVDFPRRDGAGKPVGRLRLLVLTSGQHDEARLRAQERLKQRGLRMDDLPRSELLQETLGDSVARELLCMACVTVKRVAGSTEEQPAYARIFATAEDMENHCTSAELAALFNQYLLVQNKFGPVETSIESKEEIDAWVNRLAEGGASYPLGLLSYPSLAELCLSLAQRLSSLSQILHSQSSNLPSSLTADLAAFVIDTSLYGEPADSSTSETDDVPEELTPKSAMALARRLGKSDKPT